jgi:hypothetical protein
MSRRHAARTVASSPDFASNDDHENGVKRGIYTYHRTANRRQFWSNYPAPSGGDTVTPTFLAPDETQVDERVRHNLRSRGAASKSAAGRPKKEHLTDAGEREAVT